MWNCSFGPPFMDGFVGLLITLMMIVTIIYIVVLTMRAFFGKERVNSDGADSLEIIKRKFASGEISEVEFQRMKEVITR